MLKSKVCGYSDVFILVEGITTVAANIPAAPYRNNIM